MAETTIRFECRGALAEKIGRPNGLAPAEWTDLSAEAAAAVERVNGKRGDTPWRDLPTNLALSQVEDVLAYAEANRGRFKDVVVLGIGGSALGLTALVTALRKPYWNRLPAPKRDGLPRVWVMDNVDPGEFAAMLEQVDRENTLFIVISKSGRTAETVSQFLVAGRQVADCLGEDRLAEHLVLVTDARQGVLRPIADGLGITSFVVPDGVGGRFSVLSPVGLLPAALVGIDVEALLAGAAAMDDRCQATDFDANPAAQSAAVQIGHYRRGRPMSVMMPYSAALRDVADWYRQLWAESLGKTNSGGAFVGPTPIKALGVTDQHSQVQLYREGPADKVFTILSVEDFGCTLPIPNPPKPLGGVAYPKGANFIDEYDFLRGKTMADLLKREEAATVWALNGVSSRPTTTITLPQVNEGTVGELLQMLMIQTAIAGEMLGINTYNQPGVEAGKLATMALMGKTGDIASDKRDCLPTDIETFDQLRAAIEEFLG